MQKYPKYTKLTSYEKSLVNNGCGPTWMPSWVKKILFAWMFHAQCGHHDWGYLVGGSELRRLECDLKFGKAMLKDVLRAFAFSTVGLVTAPLFFIIVLLFGFGPFQKFREV